MGAGPLLTRWIVDTGVWLKLAEGWRPSPRLWQRVFEPGDLLLPPFCLAEATSILIRHGRQGNVPGTSGFMRRKAALLEADDRTFARAGRSHGQERSRGPTLSLADALLLSHAVAENAHILTTDNGFKGNRQGVRVTVV